MPELLTYFEHTCIRDRRWPGRSDVMVPPSPQ